LGRIWPGQEIFEDTLRVHVHRLRSKIEGSVSGEKYIHTERGLGYRFYVT
jgi:DNA-binding response OmpR family regulator